MKKPSFQKFQKWAKDCKPAAMVVLQAKAFAITERARVDAYIKPIFDGLKFTYGADHGDKAGQPIPSPAMLWCCDDEAGVAAFYAQCAVAHKANGFQGEDGYCPALIAANLLITAENALIDLAEPLFGVDLCQLGPDTRKQYLDLLISGCLNAERMAA